ncbi:MAG: zinc ribbon domain-containing protein [Ahniella sp.]|nr:zinc ribbon domain-containing protein [Ahniella sp.]
MILCASCSEPILESARFCPACGIATAVAEAPVASPAPSADTAINQAAVAVPRHVEVSRAHLMPGLLLGGRYRRVALLGRADRQGAMRLTLFLAACALLAQILRADRQSGRTGFRLRLG